MNIDVDDVQYIGLFDEKESQDYIKVGWSITSLCNFTCIYCTAKPNRTKYANLYPTLDFLIHKFSKFKYPTLIVLGGEPTLHDGLFEIVDVLKKEVPNTNIEIFTNLSAPLDTYKTLQDKGARIEISWHGEADDTYFINKVKNLVPKDTTVYIMYEAENYDRVVNLHDNLFGYCHLTVPLLRDSFNFKSIYTEEDKLKYEKFINLDTLKYNVKLKNGSIVHTNSNGIRSINNWCFKNWLCAAGKNRLFIQPDGKVYACTQCATKDKHYLYNVSERNKWDSNKHTLCSLNYCSYLDTYKKKVF